MINWNQMIEPNEIFFENDQRIALWCNAVQDTTDMAGIANLILEKKIPVVSVPPETVSFLWACLEKTDVKILTRYNFSTIGQSFENAFSEISKNISDVQKQGAHGVQIFLDMNNFEKFINTMSVIRDGLFFWHELSIIMDIDKIEISDWNLIFKKLREIRATAFGIYSSEDNSGKNSKFIGRIFTMLKNWDFIGDLHLILKNDFYHIDQVIRLAETEKPELVDKIHVFIES